MNIQKTNAARLLEQHKIAYQLVSYDVDENDLGAEHVAQQLGEDVDSVFKTIVLRGDRTGIFVCVVPATAEVDLKKAAKVIGDKKCELIRVKELLSLTGYVRGGCSPIGMKKSYPTIFQQDILHHPYVFCSAGQRGLQFRISPQDLIAAAHGHLADVVPSPLSSNNTCIH